jgi:hypothetical protein
MRLLRASDCGICVGVLSGVQPCALPANVLRKLKVGGEAAAAEILYICEFKSAMEFMLLR